MKIDSFNIEIISLLKTNARMSFAKIGKAIGLTAPAVAQRIQSMESEGIIEGYTIALNEEKLGIDIKAIITVKYGLGKRASFLNSLDSFPEIQSCFLVTGEDCVIMTAHLRNNQHLVSLLDRIAEYGISKTSIILDDLVKSKKAI
tara:strand:- start:6674 stop:7108 length:435 start_codon:yes stop_codon:yes gene_type:complete